MGESAPQLQILLNCAREEHLGLTAEMLRAIKLQKMLGVEEAPEWTAEQNARLIKARRRHKALIRRMTESFSGWPLELGGES